MKTYIIKTKSDEFYCGKTNDIEKRVKEHKKEKHPHWFNSKIRKNWVDVLIFKGDIEKKIKSFGVEKFYYSCLYSSHIIGWG